MRLAEKLRRHASESALLAIMAGEAPSAHVSSCAACRARLDDLRAWASSGADDAAAIADEIFTPERLAAQKQQVLARLEALGRPARVIAFPLGAPAPSRSRTSDVLRWAAAAAVGGVLVGLASGRMLDRHFAPGSGPLVQNTPSGPAADREASALSGLDEAALLDAAYDRVSLDVLETIDEMTPRVREVARASIPGSRR